MGDVFLALHGGRDIALIAIDHLVGGHVQALLQLHGVGPGGDVAQALGDDRLGQDGGGGGAVAGHVVRLGGGLLQQLGAHVLEGLLEFDLLGDGDAVVGDGGGTELLVEGDVAALGAKGGLHGLGEDVDPPLEGTACLLTKNNLLGHFLFPPWA